MAVEMETVLCASLLLCFLATGGVESVANCENTPTSGISCTGLDALPPSSELFVDPQITTVSIVDSPSITSIPTSYFDDLPRLTTMFTADWIDEPSQPRHRPRFSITQMSLFQSLAWKCLPRLNMILTLSNTGLATLRLESFRFLPELTSLILTGNLLVCNATIDWLRTWRDARESNQVTGTCEDMSNINDYLDTLPESNPTMVTFPQEKYDIQENAGETHITIGRVSESLESTLATKVVTIMRGITEEELRIANKELEFQALYFETQIDISVLNDDKVNAGERSLDMFLVPGPLTAIGDKASITVVDDDVAAQASTPSSKTGNGGDGGNGDDKKTDNGADGERGKGSSVVVIVVIIIVLTVIIGSLIILFLWKKKNDRKVKTGSGGQASYSAVKGEGENKVYNETTEQIA